MTGGRQPAICAAIAVLLGLAPTLAGAAATPERLIEQLKAQGIRDARVLDAFRRVPRSAFVPMNVRDRAYEDRPLPIGHGQTISQPYIVALMTELLGITGKERVLEIGTGSGYQAAILAELAREVYSVEIVPELAASARLRLTRQGYRNVHVKQGDGWLGWREYGPYDAVLVTAVAPRIPRALVDQLQEGGVLVMPIGEESGRQVLVRGVKRGGKLRTREITEVRFVPMTGEGARRRERIERQDREAPAPRERRPEREFDGEGPPERELREENLPREPDEENGRRGLRNERNRAARVRDARGRDRQCASDGVDRGAAGSRAARGRAVA